jgi:hypothetical protein
MLAALGAGDLGSANGANTWIAKTRAKLSDLKDTANAKGLVYSRVY